MNSIPLAEKIPVCYFRQVLSARVYIQAQMTDEEYGDMLTKLDEFRLKRNQYRYNLLGLPAIQGNIAWGRRKHYTCSGFVAYCMRDILKFNKHYSLVKPEDFMMFDFEKIYEGTAGDYHYEKQ